MFPAGRPPLELFSCQAREAHTPRCDSAWGLPLAIALLLQLSHGVHFRELDPVGSRKQQPPGSGG